MVYLQEEPLQKLKAWAKEENRPSSNLAATILMKAIEDWETQKKTESSEEEKKPDQK